MQSSAGLIRMNPQTNLSTVKDVLSSYCSIGNLLSDGLTHFVLVEINQCAVKVPVTRIYGQLDTIMGCASGCLLKSTEN